jgi:hypothetical protein
MRKTHLAVWSECVFGYLGMQVCYKSKEMGVSHERLLLNGDAFKRPV